MAMNGEKNKRMDATWGDREVFQHHLRMPRKIIGEPHRQPIARWSMIAFTPRVERAAPHTIDRSTEELR